MGTYTTGWTEYRIVLDFTNQTYTLSKPRQRHRRLDAAQGRRRHRLRHPDARHRTVTATHGTRCEAYQNAHMWVDDVAYSRQRHHRPRHHASGRAHRPCRHPGHRAGRLVLDANTEPDLAGYKVYRDGVAH